MTLINHILKRPGDKPILIDVHNTSENNISQLLYSPTAIKVTKTGVLGI